MDKKDAKLFTSFCQFVWVFDEFTPLIYEANGDIYKKHGITFDRLKHLDAIGLISFESISGYLMKVRGKYWYVSYYGRTTQIEFLTEGEQKFITGHVILTTTGKELVQVCGSTSNEEFYQYIIQKWFQQELIISSMLLQR
jgi:hypothetical protein